MSDEDEVGQEFDRVLRSVMMGSGQVREQLARARSNRDQKDQATALSQIRNRERETSRLRDMVSRDSFWATANGERVANATTYGATLYNTDPNAAAVYDIVREKAQERYGLNVDQIRAARPSSEDERRKALMNALDDQLAADRDRQEAERALKSSVDAERDVEAERDDLRESGLSEPEVEADANVTQLEDRALDERADSMRYDVDADRHESRADRERGIAQSAPRRAQQRVSASYPSNAKTALAQSRQARQPKARTTASKKNTRPRSSGLSR